MEQQHTDRLTGFMETVWEWHRYPIHILLLFPTTNREPSILVSNELHGRLNSPARHVFDVAVIDEDFG